jgi:regulation of enolase protein 1 (concanavalin A-like superfamily)
VTSTENSANAPRIDGLPAPLRWLGQPTDWSAKARTLMLGAGPRSDWFAVPGEDTAPVLNAPALLCDTSGDYLLSARVGVEFHATFDAGALVLYTTADRWAKLAFEFSPEQEPTIVSVVTRGRSDDANAFTVETSPVWLRIASLSSAFAFHASTNGSTWQLIRHFSLGEGVEPAVGFLAQSPTGEGCTASFQEIALKRARLHHLRDGS